MPSPRATPPAASQPSTPAFELRRSAIQGQGAFALRPIKKGERLIEYLGERISQEEADERYNDEEMSRHHTFLFSVDDDTVIDAAVNGNEARFINHSCNPNCEAVNDKKRIFIEAIRDIAVGEELSYDYGYERADDGEDEWREKTYVCRCGAPNCRGTILAPPREEKRKPARKTRAKSSPRGAKKKQAPQPTRSTGGRKGKKATRRRRA